MTEEQKELYSALVKVQALVRERIKEHTAALHDFKLSEGFETTEQSDKFHQKKKDFYEQAFWWLHAEMENIKPATEIIKDMWANQTRK